MANRKVSLSTTATEYLSEAMVVLELDNERPTVLKIAFAKGYISCKGAILPELEDKKGFVIPDGVISGDDYLLFKHLIFEKLGQTIEDPKQIDDYLARFIDYGLRVMHDEIKNMSSLDNYLLLLLQPVL
jgi:hypothetical protein